jgi:hypothetical protein
LKQARKERFIEEQLLEEQLEEELGEKEIEPGRPQTEWQKLRLQLVGTNVGKQILFGDWLALRNWSAEPWLDRLAGGWLNLAEKRATEFLSGDADPRWSELWRASVIAAALAGALFVIGQTATLALGILAAAVSAMLGVPVLGGNWPATSPGRLSGKLSPVHGCYPLEYRTACRAMWKINLVRTAAWLPIGALMGALMGLGNGSGAGLGAWLVLKGALAYAAAIPLLSAGHFSKSTNDSTNLQLSTLPLLGFAVLIVIMLAAAAIMTLVLPAAWALVSLGATLAIALSAWWLYGRFYERGQVDLLRDPK